MGVCGALRGDGGGTCGGRSSFHHGIHRIHGNRKGEGKWKQMANE